MADRIDTPSDVVSACLEAFADRDVERFLTLADERVRWQPASALLAPHRAAVERYVGHDGIRRWFEDAAAWVGYTLRPLRSQEHGDKVFVPVVATLVADDEWLARAVFFVFTVRDGKIVDLCSWLSEREARAHAELPAARASLATDPLNAGSLQFPADASALGQVRTRLREVTADAGMTSGFASDLLVAITEAITNAIAHGRPYDDGTIRLGWAVEDDLFAICIDDCGQFGGDREPEAASEEHGRGMAVMQLLVDELTIEARADGTTVRLAKRLACD